MKEFLSQKGVAFTDRNIKNPDALAEFKNKGYEFIPVTEIDGQVIHGALLDTIELALAEA